MRRFCFILGIVCFSASVRAAGTPIYYSTITLANRFTDNYYAGFSPVELATDLALLLEKARPASYTTLPYEGQRTAGIYLILDSSLPATGTETGYLEYQPNKIIFKARYVTGLSYALYSWLDEKGFRFYLPGESWTVMPKLSNLFEKKLYRKTYQPAFAHRMFFPSGVAGPVKGIDEKRQMLFDWRRWSRRNRMGCGFIWIDGHTGEKFILANKTAIEADSLILAPVNGKRSYRSDAKLDPTYAKGVQLFARWITEQYLLEQENWPAYWPPKTYYTTDMGDGLNYCHTPACDQQFGTVSDQSVFLLNQCAAAIRQINERAGASTLAYAERADTSRLPLASNTFMLVVPGAFQQVTSPTALLKRWAQKTKQFSAYEYLAIDVWNWGMPFMDLSRLDQYIRYLQQIGASGIQTETGMGSLSAGVGQYLQLQLLCNPKLSVTNLFARFCRDNFGTAAAVMQQLLKEWYFSPVHLLTNYDHPSFESDELGRFFRYLKTAGQTAGLTEKHKRNINDCRIYLLYQVLYFETFADQEKVKLYFDQPALRQQQYQQLLRYIWSFYPNRIFQSPQLSNQLQTLLDASSRKEWNYANADLREKPLLRGSEWDSLYEAAENRYLPDAVEAGNPADIPWKQLVKLAADSVHMASADEKALTDFRYPLRVYADGPASIRIRFQAAQNQVSRPAGSSVAMFAIESDDYAFTRASDQHLPGSSGTVVFNLPKKGFYQLWIMFAYATPLDLVLQTNNCLLFFNKQSPIRNGFQLQETDRNSRYSNRYLAWWQPANTALRFTTINHQVKNQCRFVDARHQPIPVTEKGRLNHYQIEAPANAGGRVVYYYNDSYRLPPVLKSSQNYYFFLKSPIRN